MLLLLYFVNNKEGKEYCIYNTKRKANWIGHILLRNCHLKDVMEGKVIGRAEVTGRRGRRPKQLLNDLKKTRGYWKIKEEALARTF